MGGVLAIDLGTKKTGLALCDALRIARRPLGTVRELHDSPALDAAIARVLCEHDIELLVVGLPVQSDGTVGSHGPAVVAFVERMRAARDVEVVTWSEHGTTKEAESRLREAGFDSHRSKELRDAWSALVILDDWLASGEPR